MTPAPELCILPVHCQLLAYQAISTLQWSYCRLTCWIFPSSLFPWFIHSASIQTKRLTILPWPSSWWWNSVSHWRKDVLYRIWPCVLIWNHPICEISQYTNPGRLSRETWSTSRTKLSNSYDWTQRRRNVSGTPSNSFVCYRFDRMRIWRMMIWRERDRMTFSHGLNLSTPLALSWELWVVFWGTLQIHVHMYVSLNTYLPVSMHRSHPFITTREFAKWLLLYWHAGRLLSRTIVLADYYMYSVQYIDDENSARSFSINQIS